MTDVASSLDASVNNPQSSIRLRKKSPPKVVSSSNGRVLNNTGFSSPSPLATERSATTTTTPANNGPRSVSFNRDVHVKRIGSRSEPRTIPSSANVRKETRNLSPEALRKEAAFVLAQADRIERTRSQNNSSPANLKEDRFNSLPSRKSRSKANLARSSSDAASKKPQKNLLGIFNKVKNDVGGGSVKTVEDKPRVTVSRSKSDVGSTRPLQRDRRTPRRNTQELKNDQLTPIIEASPLEYTKPLDPLTTYQLQQSLVGNGQVFPKRSTSKPVMETIALLRQHSQSPERLHSSQLPPEKPTLTKGVTVENIVRRLSNERHASPPPAQIVRDGFSYTRPGEPIVYAQVVCSNEGKEKHTIRNQYTSNTSDEEVKKASPHHDFEDMMTSKDFLTKRPSPPLPKYTLDETDNFPRTRFKTYNSDEDEGLGIEYGKRFSSSYLNKTPASSTFIPVDDDHITPTMKYVPSYTSHSFSSNYRGQADGKEYLPEFSELSHRREILESRIRSRIGSRDLLDKATPEREINRGLSSSRYENYHSSSARRSYDRLASQSPVRRRTVSPVPVHEDMIQRKNAKNQFVETFVTKTVVNRDGRPYSEEFTERFKYPNKNVEDVRLTRTTFDREGSVERKEVQNFTRNLSESAHSRHVMDKGDSGIENDIRKDSFNSEYPLGKKYTLTQNIQACERFLWHERAHTNNCVRRSRKVYSYRERSIDDGSRYDPRLDTDRYGGGHHSRELKSSLKQEKKVGGLAKMKQFMSSTKKKLVKMGDSDKKDSRQGSIRSEERMRYDDQYNSRVPDIANRRRLSTPKSSPSTTKRSLSFKSTKTNGTSKSSGDWFKSFDRMSRKKSQQDSKSQLSTDAKSSIGGTKQPKSLRFFGDTDNESQPKPSRSKSSLSKVHKKYQSAYDLEATPKIRETRYRSSSMQNLDDEEHRYDTKQRNDLYDISEHSTSYRTSSPAPIYPPRRNRSVGRDYTPERSANRKSYSASRSRENSVDLVDSERYHQRTTGRSSRSEQQHRKPPSGPQKPARLFERGGSLTRETDRVHDSSGTEGESSQQSQRSVVYLHATTVGDIPHPQIANARRMAYSRESLNSPASKKAPPQPMTRTISRSISVLAPWKPKHIRDGYEIDYHSDQHQVPKPISTLPRPGSSRNRSNSASGSQSTLGRNKQKTKRASGKDEPDSDKSSSFDNPRSSLGGTRNNHTAATRMQSSSSRTNTLQKHRKI
ncbi:uncharacterized protein LOC129746821 [Uranotaenia lowii]|uniref:uncharacterized protein LOC129746821 n=1 Tax=Uranotaenia lowii TaxID=190385 RepID=UPI002479FA90|nr:uncharacterized protein LOC129746821 [Uranotaenia lowii]